MSANISSLYDSIKAVHANSVENVASPIDEFKTVSEGITGDLSNTLKTFAFRFTLCVYGNLLYYIKHKSIHI